MRDVILVELLLVLDKFILLFRLRAHLQSKMFLTTSSKESLGTLKLYLLPFFECG